MIKRDTRTLEYGTCIVADYAENLLLRFSEPLHA